MAKQTKIDKRTNIDETIFQELSKKYPRTSELNGVVYDQTVQVVSIPPDLLDNSTLRRTIKQYGNDVFAVYLYYRSKMCSPHGYRVCVDDIDGDDLREKLAFLLYMDESKIDLILNVLFDAKLFYLIRCPEDGMKYILCPQQILNWEMLMEDRKRNRNRKREEQAETEPIDDEVKTQKTPCNNRNNIDESKPLHYIDESIEKTNTSDFFGNIDVNDLTFT